jgi:hypothetical protein
VDTDVAALFPQTLPTPYASLWPDDVVSSGGSIRATGSYSAGTGLTTLTATATIFTPAMNLWLISIQDNALVDHVCRITYVSGTAVTVVGDITPLTTKAFVVYNWFASYVHSVVTDYHWTGTESLVTAYYAPPTPGRVLENNPGHGILEVGFSEIARERHWSEDTTPLPISAVIWNANDGKWYMYRPDGMVPASITAGPVMLYLSVVLTSLPATTISSLIGKTNSGALSAFGDLGGAGKVLFHAPLRCRQIYRAQTLYFCVFRLEFNPVAWASAVKVEKLTWETHAGHSDWNSGLTPTYTSAVAAATTADFSVLNGYLL